MATQNLQLIIYVTNGGAASSAISHISTSARSASTSLLEMNRSLSLTTDSLRFMRGALVAISFAKVFEEVGKGISTMQQIHNLLTQVTDSSEQNSLMFEKLAESARKVHAPLDDFAKMFVNIQRSTAAYKVSTDDVIKANQSMFATFALSGLDSSAIRNVSKDMREVFNLGIVQGRQFRAIVTQDQQEALLLSKYIVSTGAHAAAVNKTLDDLRSKGATPNIYEMSMQNKRAFTGADILRANIAAHNEMMERMGKTTVTVGQAMTDLNTQWLRFLNYLQQANGIWSTLAGWIETVANYLPEIVLLAGVVASLLAINFVTSAFLNFASLVGGALKFVLSPLLSIGEALLLLPLRMGSVLGAVGRFGDVVVSAFTLPYRAILALSEGVFTFVRYTTQAIQAGVAFGSTVGQSIMSLVTGALSATVGMVGNLLVGFISLAAIAVPMGAALYAAWLAAKDVLSTISPDLGELTERAKRFGITFQDIPILMEQAMGDMFSHFSDYKALLGDFGTLFGESFVRYFVAALHAGTHDVVAAMANWFQSSWLGKGMTATYSALGTTVDQTPYYGVGHYLGKPSSGEQSASADITKLIRSISLRVLESTAAEKAAVAGASATSGGSKPGAENQFDSKTAEKIRKATEAFKDYIAGMAPGGPVLKAVAEAQKQFDDAAHKGVNIQKILNDYGLTRNDVMKQAARAAAGLNAPMDELTKKEAEYAVLVKDGYMSQDEMNQRLDSALRKAVGLKGGLADLTDQQKLYTLAVKDGAITQAIADELLAKATREQQIARAELENSVGGGITAALLKKAPGSNVGATAQSAAEEFLKNADAADTYKIKLQTLNEMLANGQVSNENYVKSLQDIQIAFLKTQTDAVSGFTSGLLEAQKAAEDTAAQVSKVMTTMATDVTDALTNVLTNKRTDFHTMFANMGTDLIKAAVNQNITGPLTGMLGPNGPAGNVFSQALGIPFGGGSGGLGGLLGGKAALGSSIGNPMFVAVVGSGGGLPGGGVGGGFGGGSDLGSDTGGGDTGGIIGGASTLTGGYGSAGGDPLFAGSSGAGGIGAAGGLLGGLFGKEGLLGSQGLLLGDKGLFGAQGMFGSSGFFSNMLSGNVSGALGLDDAAGLGGIFGNGGAFSATGLFAQLGGLLGFASGGEFTVGGVGGVDSQLVAFKASPDETVSIRRPGEASQPLNRSPNISVHLHGVTDADSFKRSSSQMTSGMLLASGRAMRRNGNGR